MRRLVAGLMIGVVVAIFSACGSAQPTPVLSQAEDVVQQLRSAYIGSASVTDDELNQAAIQGMLNYINDPYTSYLPPQQYKDFTAALGGSGEQFDGIGAEVTIRNDQVMIVGPLPDSPASKAGIQPGDIILAVDGKSTAGMQLLDAVQLIRGPKGSSVTLTISRAGELKPMDVTVVRDTITVTSVFYKMQTSDIGYIQLSSFDEKTADEMIAGIKALKASGAKGLILDLRNNSGGLVDAAVDVVSQFVPTGLVCTGCNPNSKNDFREVTGNGIAYDIPLVVLVNSYSASASEIVAGALQDHGRAELVGTRTFGKGSVDLLLPLKSGAGLYVTTARWHTPNGRLIEGQGIEPDVVVGNGVDVKAEEKIGALSQSLCQTYDQEKANLANDQQLTQALDGLCNLSATPAPSSQAEDQLNAAIAELQKAMN